MSPAGGDASRRSCDEGSTFAEARATKAISTVARSMKEKSIGVFLPVCACHNTHVTSASMSTKPRVTSHLNDHKSHSESSRNHL